jgi:hypothetical protein
MHAYRLKLLSQDAAPSSEIEFETSDAYQALSIAHAHAGHKPAELWYDRDLICTIQQAQAGYWHVMPERAAGWIRGH